MLESIAESSRPFNAPFGCSSAYVMGLAASIGLSAPAIYGPRFRTDPDGKLFPG